MQTWKQEKIQGTNTSTRIPQTENMFIFQVRCHSVSPC